MFRSISKNITFVLYIALDLRSRAISQTHVINMYMLSHVYEGNMRYIFRVLFFRDIARAFRRVQYRKNRTRKICPYCPNTHAITSLLLASPLPTPTLFPLKKRGSLASLKFWETLTSIFSFDETTALFCLLYKQLLFNFWICKRFCLFTSFAMNSLGQYSKYCPHLSQ